MKRNLAFIVLVVVAVSVLLFTGQSLAHRFGWQSGQLGPGDVAGAVAPDFELNIVDANGKTMKLSNLKGKAVLLNFWATWCEPCKVEMPWFVDLQKEYGPQGLQIVGVSMDDEAEKTVSDFAKKMGVNYPILAGTEKVAELYGGIEGLPTSFFIDRSGKVVTREAGLISQSRIVDNIKKSLGLSTQPKTEPKKEISGLPNLSEGDPLGATAPDFQLKLLDAHGKTMKLSDLRGKAVVLDFWATYCVPCKIEMPWFVDLQKQYGPQGLQIVGVAIDDEEEKVVSEFSKKMGVNYPILIGTENVAESYGGLPGLPTTFFLDRSGKVVAREVGLVSESQIVDNIKKSLGEARRQESEVGNQNGR
ncbi:MAG TPA: TlpA disulfide reductase family protein [Candidatus Angelobacter sp.]|jgi:cytochrome c biogenesis protein CcmG/thiol:disulfide interchange protein DsbE|nr:TlpA disulfide reductase family protein [Candidatus Angelobacter sp.]